jgi:N-acetylglucosaminyldiphosphoundecaprenol N-acetyl-beta-D-mannosaminyltransferase
VRIFILYSLYMQARVSTVASDPDAPAAAIGPLTSGSMFARSRRANILGVGVSPITMDQAVGEIETWIAEGRSHYVCITNIHGIVESQRDKGLRQIHNNAGLVTPDGMPLVWASHLLGFRSVERVYGPDLVLALCERSAGRGYRHYFFGGAPGVAGRMAECLRHRFPGLAVAGEYTPPFHPLTPEEDEQIVQTINEAHPDVVWVGLSTPKQERWMAAHVGQVNAAALIGVGAAFDFLSGSKRQAPRWMQRSGLEWFFRVVTEPRRLWRRYATNIPAFLGLFFAQVTGLRRYGLD